MVGAEPRLVPADAAPPVGGGNGLFGAAPAPSGAGNPRPAGAERGRVRHRHAQKVKVGVAVLALVAPHRVRPALGLLYSGLNGVSRGFVPVFTGCNFYLLYGIKILVEDEIYNFIQTFYYLLSLGSRCNYQNFSKRYGVPNHLQLIKTHEFKRYSSIVVYQNTITVYKIKISPIPLTVTILCIIVQF